MECPKCKAENPEYAIFCGTCSAPIREPSHTDRIEDNSVRCGSCGTENPSVNRYCGACGSHLPHEETGRTGWTKTYGMPGFYESSISEGPYGAEIQTRFSFLGFQETSRYPRWMITGMAWFLVGLIFILGLLIISETDRLETGAGVILVSFLVAYALYRVYYKPPPGHTK